MGNNYWFLEKREILKIDKRLKKFIFIPPYNPIYTQSQSSDQQQSHNKLSIGKHKLSDLYKRLQ